MGGKKKEAKEKPLEKMTAKELREAAIATGEIVGASGMNKEELLSAIRQARGIEEPQGKKADSGVREMKEKMKAVKAKYQEAMDAADDKMAEIYRKRAIRLKKKIRRAA